MRALALPLRTNADGDARWWAEALRFAEPAPRVVALVKNPSLALEAAVGGVADIVVLPASTERPRDVIERAVTACGGALRVLSSDTASFAPEPRDGEERPSLPTLRGMETALIGRALEATNGHISAAARLLGIHRNTLTRKMQGRRIRSGAGNSGSMRGESES